MRQAIFVTQSSMPPIEEYIDEIRELWDTHRLTNMGHKHKLLAAELKEYLEAEEIDLFVNGHMSIELCLQAMNLSGEVITTPFTFASTTHAIIRNGLTPVFADIDPITFTLDPRSIENAITDRTTAIMPVHVYGNVCNVEEIDRIAQKYGLRVIYDACHAFGVKYREKGIASFGDASCFSFHATKVFNTIEGGAVCFRDKELGEKLYDLKNFGIRGEERVESVGANAKMNEFSAAMGICNLRHIVEEIAKRKAVAERYRENLSGVEGLQLNIMQEEVEPNYSYFPVLFDENVFGSSRNDVFERLAENGIMARKYFYPLTSMFECFCGRFDSQKTPEALRISNQVLTLPLYADLSMEHVDRICQIVLSCRKSI